MTVVNGSPQGARNRRYVFAGFSPEQSTTRGLRPLCHGNRRNLLAVYGPACLTSVPEQITINVLGPVNPGGFGSFVIAASLDSRAGAVLAPPRPRAFPHSVPRKPVLPMPITLRTPPPPQTRANITARCAELARERCDLDPAGPAYEAKSLQLDAALSALWALGPLELAAI